MEQKSDCLFCNAAAEWLSAISPELKASSEGRYRNVLNNHLLPEFGGLRNGFISSAMMFSFLCANI